MVIIITAWYIHGHLIGARAEPIIGATPALYEFTATQWLGVNQKT